MKRMALQAILLAMATGAAGCSCSSNPCGGCGPAEACDSTTKKCAPALAYGAACEDDAGQPLALPCEDGTSCETTGLAPPVCATTCNPAVSPTTCPSPQVCWSVVDDAGVPVEAANGTALGYCANIAGNGQICGPVGLSFCDPSLACVFFVQGSDDGVCFAPCAPPSNADCTAPEECLAVFADPTVGICAIPQPPDAGCVEAEGLFCPPGELCLDPGDGGSCFARCTPGASGCSSPQTCLLPSPGSTVGVCALSEPPGGVCDPLAGEFCDSSGLCILQNDGGAVCDQICNQTDPSCPAGQECEEVEGSSLDVCG